MFSKRLVFGGFDKNKKYPHVSMKVLTALFRCKAENFTCKTSFQIKISASHLCLIQRLFILTWANTTAFVKA